MEKVFSISDLKGNKITAGDPIVIPDWLLDSILGLCKLDVEYSGQLVCYKKIVEYPFLSANGTTGSVYPKTKIVFNDPKDWTTIEFHTHTKALGEFWTTRFSPGDLNTFDNRIAQEGEAYQHVLFTTENVLTWGKHSAPDVRIGFKETETVKDNFTIWNEKYKCWNPLTNNIES